MLLGIDLGGTKIEGIVLKSKENPEEVIRHRAVSYTHLTLPTKREV